MIEHELSYVVSEQIANEIMNQLDVERKNHIVDFYLSPELRVRELTYSYDYDCADKEYFVTRKKGNKSDGYRFEDEEIISDSAANILKDSSKLNVHKIRHSLKFDKAYKVTIDKVVSPMNVYILEIEGATPSAYPVKSSLAKEITGLSLKECPLSSYQYFKRKIGICGAPSSGKTETAKKLSNVLNTTYNANSFSVTEFATSFIQKYKRNPKINDQFFMWHGQHLRELDAHTANIVISDCPTFLSYIYTLLLHNSAFNNDTAFYISKIYKRVLMDISSYSDILFLEMLNYEDNNVRYQTKEEALDIQRRILSFLNDHNIAYRRYNYRQFDDMMSDILYMNTM